MKEIKLNARKWLLLYLNSTCIVNGCVIQGGACQGNESVMDLEVLPGYIRLKHVAKCEDIMGQVFPHT